MRKLQICEIAQTIRATYLNLIRDKPLPSYQDLSEGMKMYILDEVNYWLKDPSFKASDSHDSWYKYKTEEGWSYGEVVDYENKKHPRIVPYSQTPVEEKIANELFMNTVKLLSEFLEK